MSAGHYREVPMLAVSWLLQGSVNAGCQLALQGRGQYELSVVHYKDASILAVSWPLQGDVSAGGQLATPGRRQCGL